MLLRRGGDHRGKHPVDCVPLQDEIGELAAKKYGRQTMPYKFMNYDAQYSCTAYNGQDKERENYCSADRPFAVNGIHVIVMLLTMYITFPDKNPNNANSISTFCTRKAHQRTFTVSVKYQDVTAMRNL
ncbi:MAG: hypothetical protein GY774_21455 [Planctomycetes bacterium]|nr:hypothetical protein [Planctomycetota bacterium]